MWTDYMSRLVTQPYVRDSQPCITVFLVPRILYLVKYKYDSIVTLGR
jgi:hypothetical protein